MSKLTVTAFSFKLNGWVNYEFPHFTGHPFEPMHGGFAFAEHATAQKYAGTSDEPPFPGHAATPREWAKMPQMFDPDTGSNHKRTFFR